MAKHKHKWFLLGRHIKMSQGPNQFKDGLNFVCICGKVKWVKLK